ncbi:MAG: OmpA family protein [Pseudomonadota bacterium]|nr:OmpA family protein [Pseudomonadota bacterium]
MMKSTTLLTLLMATLLTSCTTYNPNTGEERIDRTGTGIGLGALGGAIVGSALGSTQGAVIGAGLGAIAGGAIGADMDRQEAMLRQRLNHSGVRVVRTGDDIRLIMPGDITFGNDSANINPKFYRTLNSVAHVMRDFRNTTIRVAGFTSDSGSDEHNQMISEDRAENVAEYLVAQNVNPHRIHAVGYGKRYPIASNATAEGRAQNRRVEVTLHAI